ncbi:MAG TPA: hypothetical protein VMY06_06275 [Sedimentisphaerales bacterium]|nr:hypothetical protein [Sedimentisphaerales bacterium]
MSDFDIDKLLSDSLTSGTVSDAFRDRLLRESTGALVSSRRFGKRLRAAGLMLTIMLIAMGAFVCGNFRGLHHVATEKVLVPAAVENEQMTSVPRELVAWLDAGRFFERLGMQERAVRAYKTASGLIDYGTPEFHEAGLDRRNFFCVIKENRRVDAGAAESKVSRKSERQSKVAETILAKCY